MSSLHRAASVSDYRELARQRLPHMLFEYIDGGSYAETTLRRNVRDLEQLLLRQRVMRNMSALDMRIETLGQKLQMPIALAPVGIAGMFARRGEIQAAHAAAAAGVPLCLSTVGICSVEEVAQAAQPPWFQLYVLHDRGFMRELLRRARAAGCPVLLLTVDLPAPAARYRDVRSGFTGLRGMRSWLNRAHDGLTHPRWLWDVWLRGRPHHLGSIAGALPEGPASGDFLSWIGRNFDRSVSWQDIDWIRAEWDRPIVIKGIMTEEDARQAVRIGAQALVVSNHGGRQLDGVRSSIAALPHIVESVGGALEIYVDGGIRSGLDALKALCLGAKLCFVGRAWAYALGAGGQSAVARLLSTLRSELELAMILTGCRTLRDAGPALLEGGDG